MEIWALTKKRGSLLLTEPGAAWQRRWRLGWIWKNGRNSPVNTKGKRIPTRGGHPQPWRWGEAGSRMGAAQGDSAGREGGDAQQVMHGQTSRGKVESHSRMRRWGDGRKVREEVDSKMREELRTRKAKAETQTKCSLSGHQRQEQNNSWFKSASILGMISALEAEQLFAKVVSEGLDSTCLFLWGKETKHFYAALMVVMTKWRSWQIKRDNRSQVSLFDFAR